MDKNTKNNETLNFDLKEYFDYFHDAYKEVVRELSIGYIADRLAESIQKNECILKSIDCCFGKRFLQDDLLLSLPVLEQFTDGIEEYFVLQDYGIEYCDVYGEETHKIFMISLSKEDAHVGIGIRNRLMLDVEKVEITCKMVKDIVPLIKEYTDLFDYPDLFPYEVLA